jgi:hypothetical protein
VRGASVVDVTDAKVEVLVMTVLLCELFSAMQSWDNVAKIATNAQI